MRVGYDNDNDHDSNDDDVDSTDFTSTWKIYLILSFNVGAESREPRDRWLRAKENQDLWDLKFIRSSYLFSEQS